MSSSDLQAVADRVLKAKVPEDVFGDLQGTTEERTRSIRQVYRRTMVLVHPDRFTSDDAALAEECTKALGEWRAAAEAKVAAGTYGDRKAFVADPPPRPTMEPQVIKTSKGQYVVESLLATGDLADIYRGSFTDKAGAKHALAFKVVQSAADNDLLEHESKVLATLYPATQIEEKFYRFLPKIHDTFMLRGSKARTNRRVNVLPLYGDHVSLADVIKAYRGGVDFRDMVWMFKRILMVLGFVHRQGVVHGAVLPAHVLVHPIEHGAKLIGWPYAVQDPWPKDGRVKAMSTPCADFYAPEILAKGMVSAHTDIFMAAQCAVALLGGDVKARKIPDAVPVQIRRFLESCLFSAQFRRPDDAWALLEEFDQMLERLVGKPKYRPLAMPA